MQYLLDSTTAVYTVAALIPAVVLMVFIYRKDKIEKEPPALLALLFLGGGGLSVVFALVGETLLQGVLDRFVSFYHSPILYNILLAFIVVACVEEGGKLIFLNLFSWKSPHFNYVFDAVVYSAFVSLGFAAIENVKYVFAYGLGVAVSRAITAVPAHLSFSILMGVFYGRAKLCEVYGNPSLAKKNLILAFVAPVFFHGFYDACCMIGGTVASTLFLLFLIFMYIIVFRLATRASRFDRPLA